MVLTDVEGHAITTSLPSHSINSVLTDIAFSAPDQGDDDSISSQLAEPSFHFTGHVPFQLNFGSKAMLDLDGTAYSGRFVTLMRSKGAVFKAHFFHEAIEHSLIPWFHYIPVSIRLSEVYSLLGFFFGAHKVLVHAISSQSLGYLPHTKATPLGVPQDRKLRAVAVQGREWAHKCARRQDHMIYAYLLALEWGRLIDDSRAGQGYVPT
jgi:hypothetical protein